MTDVLVLTATDFEQSGIMGRLDSTLEQTVSGRRWTTGLLADRRLWLVEAGLGAVNTASALTAALEFERPQLVLQVGVGGAYPGSGLGVGDAALAKLRRFREAFPGERLEGAAAELLELSQRGRRGAAHRLRVAPGQVRVAQRRRADPDPRHQAALAQVRQLLRPRRAAARAVARARRAGRVRAGGAGRAPEKKHRSRKLTPV